MLQRKTSNGQRYVLFFFIAMLSSEENELKELVTQTLETKGVLNKMRVCINHQLIF